MISTRGTNRPVLLNKKGLESPQESVIESGRNNYEVAARESGTERVLAMRFRGTSFAYVYYILYTHTHVRVSRPHVCVCVCCERTHEKRASVTIPITALVNRPIHRALITHP